MEDGVKDEFFESVIAERDASETPMVLDSG